jgi:hypothetical protein
MGEYATAAQQFARADELSPNLVALRLALIAATRADDAVLAMTLVMRARERERDAEVDQLIETAQTRFGERIGLIQVACDAPACQMRIGERSAGKGALVVVEPGEVEVQFGHGASLETLRVSVAPGQTVEVTDKPRRAAAPIQKPAAPRPLRPIPAAALRAQPVEHERFTLPQTVFWGGVILSAVLGGTTAVSALDTQSKRESFEQDRTTGTRDPAMAAMRRTNWLLASTILSGAVTSVVGIFFTEFNASKSARARADELTPVWVF